MTRHVKVLYQGLAGMAGMARLGNAFWGVNCNIVAGELTLGIVVSLAYFLPISTPSRNKKRNNNDRQTPAMTSILGVRESVYCMIDLL